MTKLKVDISNAGGSDFRDGMVTVSVRDGSRCAYRRVPQEVASDQKVLEAVITKLAKLWEQEFEEVG